VEELPDIEQCFMKFTRGILAHHFAEIMEKLSRHKPGTQYQSEYLDQNKKYSRQRKSGKKCCRARHSERIILPEFFKSPAEQQKYS